MGDGFLSVSLYNGLVHVSIAVDRFHCHVPFRKSSMCRAVTVLLRCGDRMFCDSSWIQLCTTTTTNELLLSLYVTEFKSCFKSLYKMKH